MLTSAHFIITDYPSILSGLILFGLAIAIPARNIRIQFKMGLSLIITKHCCHSNHRRLMMYSNVKRLIEPLFYITATSIWNAL